MKPDSSTAQRPLALLAIHAPKRATPSIYPEPFASRMTGRSRRALGELFGLDKFGVNLIVIAPHSASSLRHAHREQDEFIYVLEGYPTLYTDEGATQLQPGMCAGFKAGAGNAHRLVNETNAEVVCLEIGDRTAQEEASYPDDDLHAHFAGGRWRFFHKDGSPYPPS